MNSLELSEIVLYSGSAFKNLSLKLRKEKNWKKNGHLILSLFDLIQCLKLVFYHSLQDMYHLSDA